MFFSLYRNIPVNKGTTMEELEYGQMEFLMN
jgi:hypothetical protein